jgi:hypothetical protein
VFLSLLSFATSHALAAPTISSLSPNSGPVGTSVTITGTNFGATQGSSTIKFGSTVATPTSWSDTQIVVLVPSGMANGMVYVTAVVGGLTSVETQPFTVGTPATVLHPSKTGRLPSVG